MNIAKTVLYILSFLTGFIPELVTFIEKAVAEIKDFLDNLKKDGADPSTIESIKITKRESLVSEAKAKFNVPEPVVRIAIEAAVMKQKQPDPEAESEVEMAKKTYPQLFGQG